MAMILLLLYAVLVILNTLDGYSTWKVIKPGHFQRELNPLARFIFVRLGIPRGIIVAEILWIAFISLVFFLAWNNPSLNGTLLVLLSAGVLIFSGVVIHNFYVYHQIKRREDRFAARSSSRENQC